MNQVIDEKETFYIYKRFVTDGAISQIYESFFLIKTSLQRDHVYSTLKQRGVFLGKVEIQRFEEPVHE